MHTLSSHGSRPLYCPARVWTWLFAGPDLMADDIANELRRAHKWRCLEGLIMLVPLLLPLCMPALPSCMMQLVGHGACRCDTAWC